MTKQVRNQTNKMDNAAASLGNLLGVLSNRVRTVNRQRAEVSKEISGSSGTPRACFLSSAVRTLRCRN